MGADPDSLGSPGFIADEVRAEFPGLALEWITVPGSRQESSSGVRKRLGALSDRWRGSDVVAMRTRPIPGAYRAFFRQVGLDPDTSRIPAEQVAVERLFRGHFRSVDNVADALAVAVVETGVAVWALDYDRIDERGLGIRTSREGEKLGRGPEARRLPPGRLVVADRAVIHGQLFGPVAPDSEVTRRTTRITLFAVGVEGVPAIHVEEALWLAREVLGGG